MDYRTAATNRVKVTPTCVFIRHPVMLQTGAKVHQYPGYGQELKIATNLTVRLNVTLTDGAN